MRDDYVRAVALVEVIDGDTFRCDVDLGFHVSVRMSCRLVGINTPERGEPGWAEARSALAELLARGKVTVASVRADKYAGRFDADVLVTAPVRQDPELGPLVESWHVNRVLVERGVAVAWDGTGPRPTVPWPPAQPTEQPG